jgi:hypothetical protein
MSRFILLRAVLAVSFITAAGSTCWAGHVRGVKASITSLNTTTRVVNINVTMYTDGPATVASTTLGSTVYARNAISWGDGVVVGTAHIPQVTVGPLGVFRGAFVHTYPNNTNRTITVSTDCCVGTVGAPNNTVNTGNPIVGYTGTVGVYDAVVTNTVLVALGGVPTMPSAWLAFLGLLLVLTGSVLVLTKQRGGLASLQG